jgi:hypothetical protein
MQTEESSLVERIAAEARRKSFEVHATFADERPSFGTSAFVRVFVVAVEQQLLSSPFGIDSWCCSLRIPLRIRICFGGFDFWKLVLMIQWRVV